MVRETALKMMLYTVSLALAIAELITGLIAQQKDELVSSWVTCVLPYS